MDPIEVDLPEPTDWMSFTYANGTAADKLTLNFESIEKLLESAKFNVNIDVGKIAEMVIGDDEPLEPGEEESILEIVKKHMKYDVFAGRNITLVFDLTASDLNKVFSSDATPVLSYFKVNGKSAGKAIEAKLSEIVSEYFGDESFFEVFKLSELLDKVLTD